MIERIIDNKVLAVLSLVFAIAMVVHAALMPKLGVVAIAVLAISYFGLIGLPALMKRKY